MGSLSAIFEVTNGLAQYLTRAHQISPIKTTSCTFLSAGTSDLKKLDGQHTTCSLFLHHVSLNEHSRNHAGSVDPKRAPLSLDLHLLMTVWADSAEKEQLVFAWAARELSRLAVMDRSVLGTGSSFAASERVQLSAEELSVDDLSRLWQVLAPPYRLSATFVARDVRIRYDDQEEHAPVVASRYGYSPEVEGV